MLRNSGSTLEGRFNRSGRVEVATIVGKAGQLKAREAAIDERDGSEFQVGESWQPWRRKQEMMQHLISSGERHEDIREKRVAVGACIFKTEKEKGKGELIGADMVRHGLHGESLGMVGKVRSLCVIVEQVPLWEECVDGVMRQCSVGFLHG
ncbi:hypothetical protein L2E82_10773 [Cichorium intybus]|uniref:Uncharacterized protein n=1 Tax=Cichorium intybus TaxID=13427 RepID=A0ACB9GBL1_CICIN|nr:hypothetical protein L2E82_10773 [Cichorium intybus]